MNTKKLLSLYGLKWNPFSPDLPTEALQVTPQIESFLWRVEQLIAEGGFALVSGEPGAGKSSVLRLLASRLASVRDVSVARLSRPQSKTGDFYRELGDLFGATIRPSNRWGGFKALRERWRAHLESSRLRPVLLVDEAQAMAPDVLEELRLLSSAEFDSVALLTVVLAGDERLVELFRREDLRPLSSRIRVRLRLEPVSQSDLRALLGHLLERAGNPSLMTEELQATLADHVAGNLRALTVAAGELLAVASAREAPQIDEKLYLELFDPRRSARRTKARS
jgi:type II secretory pathway predicted ATPase ExeA